MTQGGSAKDVSAFYMNDLHWQKLRKAGDLHKHCYGHAVIVSGPTGCGGAARLAARGALRIGAGLVSVLCSVDDVQEHAAQLNAIMVKSYDQKKRFLSRLEEVKPSAICIGPNLGLDATGHHRLSQALKLGASACIDADAITLLSGADKPSYQIANPNTVMTPHQGELCRFIPDVFERTTDRLEQAKAAALKAGCVILYKGPETIVAAPEGRCTIVSSSEFPNAGWLATAGSGDVLAGFITGLLARGLDAFEAAQIGAYLHFRCADAFGPGLIAEDISEMLPRVLR